MLKFPRLHSLDFINFCSGEHVYEPFTVSLCKPIFRISLIMRIEKSKAARSGDNFLRCSVHRTYAFNIIIVIKLYRLQ